MEIDEDGCECKEMSVSLIICQLQKKGVERELVMVKETGRAREDS